MKDENLEPEKIDIDEPSTDQMDIFTTGFVKPISVEDAIKQVYENNNHKIEESSVDVEEKQDVIKSKALKNNNEIAKEKIIELIETLDEEEEIREENIKNKRRKKNMWLIIGILIEIAIIAFIYYNRFIKETYSSQLTCSNTTHNKAEKYYITMENVYYFDEENKVAKTKNSITYKFENEDSYKEYEKDYIDSDIKGYKGITQKSVFDKNQNQYTNTTTYTYSKLKQNKNVKFENNLITANIEGRDKPITIYIQNIDEVKEQNKNMGFMCN